MLDVTTAVKPKVVNLWRCELAPSPATSDRRVCLRKFLTGMRRSITSPAAVSISAALANRPNSCCASTCGEDVYVRPDWKTGDVRVRINIRNATEKATRANLQ